MVIGKLLSVGQPVWQKSDDYCPCELSIDTLKSYDRRLFHSPVMRDIYEVFVAINLLKVTMNEELRVGVPPTSDE